MSLNKNSKIKLFVWVAIHALLFFVFLLRGGFSVSTSLYDILPETSYSHQLNDAENKLSESLNSNLTILVGHQDFTIAKSRAQDLSKALESVGSIDSIQLQIDSRNLDDIRQVLHKYRYQFLSSDVISDLESGQVASISSRAYLSLMSPVSMGALDYLPEDPFLLADDNFQNLIGNSIGQYNQMLLKDSVLASEYDGKWWVLVTIKLGQSGGSVSVEDNPVERVITEADYLRDQDDSLELLLSGVPVHTYYSTINSQREITFLSGLSTIFIIGLLLIVFRSLTPLWMTVLAIGFGICSGLMGTMLVFENIHIFTIVFGTSLIGISVDYSFHYFAEWSTKRDVLWNKSLSERIFGGVTTGLITTIISYVAFTFSGFPLLQEIALFSIFGLLSTYTSVFCFYPIAPLPSESTVASHKMVSRIMQKVFQLPLSFSRRSKRVVVSILLLFLILGLSRLSLNNSMSDLYTMSSQLKSWEEKSAHILQSGSSGLYLIIEGDSLSENLKIEEALIQDLEKLVKEEAMSTPLGLSLFLPSESKQNQNWKLLQNTLFPHLKEQCELLGLDIPEIPRDNNLMTLRDLESLPIKDMLFNLNIGMIEDRYYTALFLFDVKDSSALQNLCNSHDSVSFVDKIGATNKVLEHLSQMAIKILLFSYSLILIIMMIRYGIKRGSRVVLIPFAATLMTLAYLSLAGKGINLFAIVALILIPGMGSDYIILLSEHNHEEGGGVILSITMSMMTTILAFGLLGFSNIAGLFGMTVGVGIFFTYILTSLFQEEGSQDERGSENHRSK